MKIEDFRKEIIFYIKKGKYYEKKIFKLTARLGDDRQPLTHGGDPRLCGG
jgi:hypothetical protein